MRRFKLNIKEIFIIICCLVFYFQEILQRKVQLLSLFDEVLVVFLLILYIIRLTNTKRINKNNLRIIILLMLLILVGIMGNRIHRYQLNYKPIILDIFSTCKVFIMCVTANSFMNSNIKKERIIHILATITRIIVLIATVCCLISLVKNIGMSKGEIRYGIRSFSFIYSNPGMFAMSIYMYLLIQTMDLKYNSSSLKRKFFIVLTILVWISTLRTRGFIFILIYIIMYINYILGKKIKIKWYWVPIILIISLLIAKSSFYKYFGEISSSARKVFLFTSIKVAKDFFPIGAGFATFGTDMAAKYYSRLYYKYDFDIIHGLDPRNPIFAHDTYWPAILGQFGIIGFILVLYIVYNSFHLIYESSKENNYNRFMSWFIIIVLLGSSIPAAIFFHFSTVGLIFMMPLMDDKENDV